MLDGTRRRLAERERRAGGRAEQGWVLALTSLASFLVILDMLVVAAALTAIHDDLGATIEELGWTVNAYTLSFAVLLMTASALGDRLGRRRLFAVGLGVFAVSSAGCALAPTAGALIALRVVQGVGAAMVVPLALALLNAAFPPQRRGWAIGIYGSVTGLAALLGPVIGGAVTQGLGWQWIFWLNVPIALGVIPLVLTRLAEVYGPAAPVDVAGLALVTSGVLGLVWGVVRGDAAGWGSAETVGTLAAGSLLMIAFVAWQRRARAPMVPLRLFVSRTFSAGNAAIFCLNASLTGAIFLMPQFLQVTLRQDALNAGLGMLPWGIAPVLIAPWAGALADRVAERWLVVTGLLLQTGGMAWIALIAAPGISYLQLIAPMSVAGVGFSLAIPAVTRSVTSTVAPPDMGKAAGVYSTVRQLGGAFGVAVHVAVFAAAGGYASAQMFSDGFTVALGVASGVALTGAIAGAALPRRQQPTQLTPS
jgi:EmrB/QacA subfamily drug resistance transporter